jgi:hypothetical protein
MFVTVNWLWDMIAIDPRAGGKSIALCERRHGGLILIDEVVFGFVKIEGSGFWDARCCEGEG